MILAALFIVGEIFTAGFFLLCFGIGAIAAGLLALAGVGMAGQLGVFVIISFVAFLASRRFAARVSKPQPPGIGADRFTGKRGIVLKEINRAQNTGMVRIDRDEWRAESENEENIAKDAEVEVTGVIGTRLIVKPTHKGE